MTTIRLVNPEGQEIYRQQVEPGQSVAWNTMPFPVLVGTLYAHNERPTPPPDWTVDEEGVGNSSETYLELVDAVSGLIMSSGHALLRGDAQSVARLIVSNLAHVHGLGPR